MYYLDNILPKTNSSKNMALTLISIPKFVNSSGLYHGNVSFCIWLR